jgi:Cytochrome P460
MPFGVSVIPMIKRETNMSRTNIRPAVATLALLAALGGVALAAQDRYSLQVPGGLAFSEFKGYQDWQMIAVSHNGDMIATILGNPAMIAAFKAGIPGNGKPFPDGAKMAKIHWNLKKSEEDPAQPLVPSSQHDVDFMVKDSERFSDSGGWGYAEFEYDAAPRRSGPARLRISRHRGMTLSAGLPATR